MPGAEWNLQCVPQTDGAQAFAPLLTLLPRSPACSPGPTVVGMATLRPGPEFSVPTSICLRTLYFMSLGLSWEIRL